MKLSEGINLVFPTPITLVRWPRHEDVRAAVDSLAPLDYVRGNPTKLESLSKLHEQGIPALDELMQVACSMATEMARSLTGLGVTELVRRRQLNSSGAFRDGDDTRGAEGGSAQSFLAIDNAWVNGYDAGHFHSPHSHPGTAFAAVYLVSAVTPATFPQGALAFQDPRREAVNHLGQLSTVEEGLDLVHQGEPGDLLVFPGWLTHYVFPHLRDTRRLSISMNISPRIHFDHERT